MSHPTLGLSRRNFLTQASCFGAFYHLASRVPLLGCRASSPTIREFPRRRSSIKGSHRCAKSARGFTRQSQTRRRATSRFATADFSLAKIPRCCWRGSRSVAGASFQMETLRSVTQIPVKAALDTHYHYDHSCGNAFYGANEHRTLGTLRRSRGASTTPICRCRRWISNRRLGSRKPASAKPRPTWRNRTRRAISTR